MKEKTTVLIVTHHVNEFELLNNEINPVDFELVILSKTDKTLILAKKARPEIIIIDTYSENIPNANQEELNLLSDIKNMDPQVEVILIGENALSQSSIEAINRGAYDYLTKPIDYGELADTIYSIHSKRLARKEIGELEETLIKKYKFQGMYGKSPQMLNLFSFVKRIAKHPTTVLVTGETGTGKELVAQAIHNISRRSKSKFVSCNCAALAESLLESELFGHVKGAFTGAHQTKYGLFEYGDGGTIFLDEIGDISLVMQTKLLRVLESREIQRVGSNDVIKTDIRVISATNKDLEKEIENKRFRKDLYYRLNVAHIHLPPLRERKEDIPLLCKYFIKKFNQVYNNQIKGMSQEVKLLLMNHRWPGNVRELEHIIERGMSLTVNDFLSSSDLPENFIDSINKKDPEETMGFDSIVEENITLKELERRYIQSTLIKAKGNKVKTAKILGLSRRSLYRKIEKYNLITDKLDD